MSGHLPAIHEVDAEHVERCARAALAAGAMWNPRRHGPGWSVATGRVAQLPQRAYFVQVDVAATVASVATLLADRMVERLPDWNREFHSGAVLQTLWARPGDQAWCVQVRYRTPWPLADRRYTYWLRRRDLPDGVWVFYQSVLPVATSPEPGAVAPGGATRLVDATLQATVHHCAPHNGGTRITHVLASDLGGALGRIQDVALTGALLDAQARDARALQRVLA